MGKNFNIYHMCLLLRTKWYNVANIPKRQFITEDKFAMMVPFLYTIMDKICPYLSENFNILDLFSSCLFKKYFLSIRFCSRLYKYKNEWASVHFLSTCKYRKVRWDSQKTIICWAPTIIQELCRVVCIIQGWLSWSKGIILLLTFLVLFYMSYHFFIPSIYVFFCVLLIFVVVCFAFFLIFFLWIFYMYFLWLLKNVYETYSYNNLFYADKYLTSVRYTLKIYTFISSPHTHYVIDIANYHVYLLTYFIVFILLSCNFYTRIKSDLCTTIVILPYILYCSRYLSLTERLILLHVFMLLFSIFSFRLGKLPLTFLIRQV